MNASNDCRFVPMSRGAMVAAARAALADFEPRAGSVLTEREQEWFAARDAVAHLIAAQRSGHHSVAGFRAAGIVADAIVA